MAEMVDPDLPGVRSGTPDPVYEAIRGLKSRNFQTPQVPPRSNRNLPSDLYDLVARQAEEIAYVSRVALHRGENALLPVGQSPAVLPCHHGFVTDIIGHVAEIDGTAPRLAGKQEGWNIRTLHEPVARRPTPEIPRNFRDRNPLARCEPRDRQDLDPQNEEVLMQGPIVLDVPDHHGGRTLRLSGQEHGGPGHARNCAQFDLGHESGNRDQGFMHA